VKTYSPSRFLVERDQARCIQCQVCVNQASFDVHYHDAADDEARNREGNCVGCQRCMIFYPSNTINIRRNTIDYRENYYRLFPLYLQPYGRLYAY
jgi:MinD superfamily P-loop ATPase